MADWPQVQEGQRYSDQGFTSGTTVGTAITSGTANTKGSWTQIVASTPYDASAFLLDLWVSSAGLDYLVDIGVGAAASEYVVLPNLYIRAGTTTGLTSEYTLVPLSIPTGTRVSARAQCSTASSVVNAIIFLVA